MIFYNNTIVSETAANSASNVHWRNNLFLGENSSPAIFSVNTLTGYTSSDYNGFRPNPGVPFSFAWTAPAGGVAADYSPLLRQAGAGAGPGRGGAPASGAPAAAGLQAHQHATLDEHSRATRQDQHSVLVDYDIFVNVPKLDAQDTLRVQKVYAADTLDFRLRPGAVAIDKGTPLANVTEGYAGRGPDLGAMEMGQTPPHYGPRK